ncbi:MAG: AraC family transcriptional regulator [Acidobacteriota bacterium]
MSKVSGKEIAKYWSPTGIDGVECLYGNYYTFAFAPHFHTGFMVGVIERGANVFACRGKEQTASRGDVILLNPEEVHTGRARDEETGMAVRMLFINPEILNYVRHAVHGRSARAPAFAKTIAHDEAAASALVRLHRALESPESVLEQECLFLSVLAQLLMRHSDSSGSDQKTGNENAGIARVCDYIVEHASENVTLDDLAKVAYLSPFHLLRVFGKKTGLPPHAYQTQVRIHKAKRLLRHDSTIAQVALATGFFDQAHFSKQFKRYVGITPGQFLARL